MVGKRDAVRTSRMVRCKSGAVSSYRSTQRSTKPCQKISVVFLVSEGMNASAGKVLRVYGINVPHKCSVQAGVSSARAGRPDMRFVSFKNTELQALLGLHRHAKVLSSNRWRGHQIRGNLCRCCNPAPRTIPEPRSPSGKYHLVAAAILIHNLIGYLGKRPLSNCFKLRPHVDGL